MIIQSKPSVLTANLQFTLYSVLPAVVHRLAGVHSAIKRTRFPNLQRQDAVVTEHPVLGFIGEVHLVFVPGHFGLTEQKRVSRYLKVWNHFSTELSVLETAYKYFEENVHAVLTFGMPLTEQLRVALYPAMTERFTKGRVNLGASDRSWFLWVGGLYTTPKQTGRRCECDSPPTRAGNRVRVQLLSTCFLNVSAVFSAAGLLTRTHQVVGEHSEDILVAHDEVGHDAVGAPVLVVDCEPLLCGQPDNQILDLLPQNLPPFNLY